MPATFAKIPETAELRFSENPVIHFFRGLFSHPEKPSLARGPDGKRMSWSESSKERNVRPIVR
jgi:hypothetical protein